MLSELCPIYIHILVLFSLLLHGFFSVIYGVVYVNSKRSLKKCYTMYYTCIWMYMTFYFLCISCFIHLSANWHILDIICVTNMIKELASDIAIKKY